MALKKDLAAFAAREALVEKAIGKKKRSAQTAEERDLRRLRRGPSMPKVVPPSPIERVGKGVPELPATMTPSFLLRFVGERSNRELKATRERVRRGLFPKDLKTFEKTNLEGLIG